MTEKTGVWTLMGETLRAVGAALIPENQRTIEEAGLNEVAGWGYLLLAISIAPEPLTLARIHSRRAYATPEALKERFNNLVEHGLLTPAEGEDAFVPTEKGREKMDFVLGVQRKTLRKIECPEDDTARLTELVKRIEEAAVALPEPEHPGLDEDRLEKLPDDMPIIEAFWNHAAHLIAFREDVHLASWKPHNISGLGWDMFTYIWREEEMTEELLNGRGHTPEGDEVIIKDLLKRGWIETADEDGKYRATEKGKAVRQESEDATDRYFYKAWDCLSDGELTELSNLLTNTRDILREAAPEQPEPA